MVGKSRGTLMTPAEREVPEKMRAEASQVIPLRNEFMLAIFDSFCWAELPKKPRKRPRIRPFSHRPLRPSYRGLYSVNKITSYYSAKCRARASREMRSPRSPPEVDPAGGFS
jgi:hypothetical protein